MSKPRVLMMVQLPPPIHGAAMMNRRAVSSERLNREFSLDILPVQTAFSIADMNKPTLRKLVRLVEHTARLVWRLVARRPDLVYYTIPSSGAAFLAGVWLLWLVRLAGVPHVLQMRSRGISQTAERSRLHQALCRWLFARGRVVVFTPRVVDDIARFVRLEQVRYLPNGIEDPLPKVMASILAKVEPPLILFLSNLIETKGPFILLEALAILKSRGRRFRAVFAGEPWDVSEQALADRVKTLGLTEVFRYVGPAYGARKIALFQSAEIFAFPTFYPLEGFPGVVLEAMAFGLPVVATDEASIPDILIDGRTGLIVPQRNAAALADALDRLLLDPRARECMGREAREDFLARFQFGRFEERLIEILWETIGMSNTLSSKCEAL